MTEQLGNLAEHECELQALLQHAASVNAADLCAKLSAHVWEAMLNCGARYCNCLNRGGNSPLHEAGSSEVR